MATRKRRGSKPLRDGQRGYPYELRLRVVQAVVEGGASVTGIARAFGLGHMTVHAWVKQFREGGADALKPKASGPPPGRRTPASEAKRAAVLSAKQAQPEMGTRKIRDALARFEALGISETTVRRILHEEGLLEAQKPALERAPAPPRRFERAEPNQLWQSDIFQFLLRKHERLYLTAFMDDHSRFIVSHAVAHHQKTDLVMEALWRGIAAYGAPREILTDQGRQYAVWRGESEFGRELRRQGIAHVKSRPQHPETLGKVERFWKTLWEEFLSRTVFADFADCLRRLELFIQAYNFQRPHQALEGQVPADRFFRASPQVREAVERNVASNALQMAHQRPIRKPFYLVGRLGDRDLTISAEGPDLKVQLGNDSQTIHLPREANHEPESRFEVEAEARAPQPTDAEVADPGRGAGGGGAEEGADDPLCALWGEAGDGRGGGERDVADDLLPAGEQGAGGDGGGALAERAGEAAGGDGGGQGPGVGGEGEDARAGEAAGRAALVRDAEAGAAREAGVSEGEGNEIGGRWQERLGRVEDEGSFEPPVLAPDAHWREWALKWERKLAGERAPTGDGHGREAAQEDLRGGAPSRREATKYLGDDSRRLRGDDRGERGGEAAGALAESLSNQDAQGDGRGDLDADAAAEGAAAEAAARAGAGSRERTAALGGGAGAGGVGVGGAHPGRGDGLREGPGEGHPDQEGEDRDLE